jgi:crotonobetainyl-CoA:carnitine CoA-transferase CaiB-like acyl-CoA transferase
VNKQIGNALAGSMPINSYKTTDGYMNIAASGNVIWARFAKAVGREDWLTWPQFKGDADRVKATELINKEVQGELGKKSTAEWVEILNKAGVPCGPIYSLDQVFEDPQIKHLGIAATVKHPILGEIKMQNQPVKLTRTPASIVRPTPEFGEQTDELLTEFGYSGSEIESLRAAKVI